MARSRLRLLGLAVAGALAIGYFVGGSFEGPRFRIPVTGTVVREERAPPGLYAMLVIDYEVGGKRYTTRLPGSRNTGGDVESFRPGDDVDLLVAEGDPTLAYRPGGPATRADNRIPAAVVAAGVVVLGLAFLLPRRVDVGKWGDWLHMK
ncbi:MAG: hypothetical protein ACRDZ7_00885 [Acidimicrobiia bacterium]